MRKMVYILIFAFLCVQMLTAQEWQRKVPLGKNESLQTYKLRVEAYFKKNNITSGFEYKSFYRWHQNHIDYFGPTGEMPSPEVFEAAWQQARQKQMKPAMD